MARETPFRPANGVQLRRLHAHSKMEDILAWLAYGEKLRGESAHGQEITWIHDKVIAWRDAKERKWNLQDPAWFPDVEHRALFSWFKQYPGNRIWDAEKGQNIVVGKNKMALFVTYPRSPTAMRLEELAGLWMHAWLGIVVAAEEQAKQGKAVAIWDANARERINQQRDQSTQSTSHHDRPRVADVCQGRQIDFCKLYPNNHGVILGGAGNEGKGQCLNYALEEALSWLKGERGAFTIDNLTRAGYIFLRR